MQTYKTALEFITFNTLHFDFVKSGASKLKHPQQMGIEGMPMAEADNLAYEFLNLMNRCTSLMFGLAASVGRAKSNYKRVFAIEFRNAEGSAKAKEMEVPGTVAYVEAHQNFSDLEDILEYIKQLHGDFEKNYYYYKHLGGNNG